MQQSRFYVEVKGIKLHFIQYGTSGPQVLLIPGITSPAITWGFVGERLGGRAQITILDNRGRGLSDQRPGLGHTTEDYAEDAAGMIGTLGLAPTVVLGHSMGARVAARLAARRPDLVRRCILTDPPVSGPGRRSYPSPLQKYLDDIDAAARGEAFPAHPKFGEAQNRMRREWLPTCSKEAVRLSHAAFHEDDMFADLPNIVCPTLLIYAGKGGVIADADAAEVTSLLKDGRSVKIDTEKFPPSHVRPQAHGIISDPPGTREGCASHQGGSLSTDTHSPHATASQSSRTDVVERRLPKPSTSKLTKKSFWHPASSRA